MDILVKYISLEENVISDNLGGKAHVLGILDVIGREFNTTFVGKYTDGVRKEIKKIKTLEITNKFYLFSIFLNVLNDNNCNCFLFRKTLVGMYVIALSILIKRYILRHKKQKFIIEMNGISGDFKVDNSILRFLLLYLNAVPLIFFDYVYCVNTNISNRLLNTKLIDEKKIFVCLNGGPTLDLEPAQDCSFNENEISLIYIGADQKKYHIDKIASLIEFHNNEKSNPIIYMDLFGSNLEKYNTNKYIRVHGHMAPSEFRVLIKNLRCHKWGIIPLDQIVNISENNVSPIKTFDYMSCGLPIIHSSSTLKDVDIEKKFTLEYNVNSEKSILNVLSQIKNHSVGEYQERVNFVTNNYMKYTWDYTLKGLVHRINDDM